MIVLPEYDSRRISTKCRQGDLREDFAPDDQDSLFLRYHAEHDIGLYELEVFRSGKVLQLFKVGSPDSEFGDPCCHEADCGDECVERVAEFGRLVRLQVSEVEDGLAVKMVAYRLEHRANAGIFEQERVIRKLEEFAFAAREREMEIFVVDVLLVSEISDLVGESGGEMPAKFLGAVSGGIVRDDNLEVL